MRGLLTRNGKAVTNPRNGITKPRVDAAASMRELYDLTSCQWSAGIKESDGTAYSCPANEVMVGRKHSGDENGTTNYYCCSAGNPLASVTSCWWSSSFKESNGTAFVCPFNQFVAGRKHSGDENGSTQYQCCSLTRSGVQVPIAPGTCGWSPGMKESSSNYQCSPAGKVMAGRQHVGDENGNTYYYCCNPQW